MHHTGDSSPKTSYSVGLLKEGVQRLAQGVNDEADLAQGLVVKDVAAW